MLECFIIKHLFLRFSLETSQSGSIKQSITTLIDVLSPTIETIT